MAYPVGHPERYPPSPLIRRMATQAREPSLDRAGDGPACDGFVLAGGDEHRGFVQRAEHDVRKRIDRLWLDQPLRHHRCPSFSIITPRIDLEPGVTWQGERPAFKWCEPTDGNQAEGATTRSLYLISGAAGTIEDTALPLSASSPAHARILRMRGQIVWPGRQSQKTGLRRPIRNLASPRGSRGNHGVSSRIEPLARRRLRR